MSKTEGEILTKILFIATLRSVRRYIGEMVIPAFTMKILLISNPMAFTVLFTPKEEAFKADTVDGYVKKVLKQLNKTYGIELRS